jgi:carbon storage regulator
MLVLSRKVGERVLIADSVVVTITQIERGRVRLGIEAPQDVRVIRAELQLCVGSLPPAATTIGAGQ